MLNNYMLVKIKNLTKQFLKEEKGNAIIQTAVVLPMVLGLFMGLVFYTNAMRYKLVMNMAAKEGARMYQISKGDSSKAMSKAYEELSIGHVGGASVGIIPNGIQVTKPYGFYIPFYDKHLLNLRSEHEFFEELDKRYYKTGW